jgi:hypothetical protein
VQIDGLTLHLQASGVFVYDAHFPVPLLGRVPAAEALALAAPYGRPAVVPGGFPARLLQGTWGTERGCCCARPQKTQCSKGRSPGSSLGCGAGSQHLLLVLVLRRSHCRRFSRHGG